MRLAANVTSRTPNNSPDRLELTTVACTHAPKARITPAMGTDYRRHDTAVVVGIRRVIISKSIDLGRDGELV